MPPWIYTVLGRRWFRGAKRNGGSDFSKPPYRQWYRKAHEILCPSAVFFFSPLWGQMFLNWFTTSINYKCYTNVRGVFDFDRKTGWIVTKLGHFKNFLRNITDECIALHLNTNFMPDPDLLIRTGGEIRLSNYLLWQCAYSELYFCDIFWPDFDKEELYKAVCEYQQRERRFGKTSEQIS